MKIAIGISGLYRNNVGGNGVRRRPVSVSSNLLEMKNKFKADMYYHTWDTELNKIPLEYRSGNFFTTPEPIMEYHPIFDPKPTRSPKHHWYRRTKSVGSNWVQTSYNTYGGKYYNADGTLADDQTKALRKNYAVIDGYYDPDRDAFLPNPNIFRGWVLNETTCQYEPPTPDPTNGTDLYLWDNETEDWVLAT